MIFILHVTCKIAFLKLFFTHFIGHKSPYLTILFFQANGLCCCISISMCVCVCLYVPVGMNACNVVRVCVARA